MARKRAQKGDQLVSALEKKEVLVGRNHNCFLGHNTRSDNLADKETERERGRITQVPAKCETIKEAGAIPQPCPTGKPGALTS